MPMRVNETRFARVLMSSQGSYLLNKKKLSPHQRLEVSQRTPLCSAEKSMDSSPSILDLFSPLVIGYRRNWRESPHSFPNTRWVLSFSRNKMDYISGGSWPPTSNFLPISYWVPLVLICTKYRIKTPIGLNGRANLFSHCHSNIYYTSLPEMQ